MPPKGRASKFLGYKKIITYILKEETGISLKASGWDKESLVKGKSWNSKKRPRIDKHPTTDKIRYKKIFNYGI